MIRNIELEHSNYKVAHDDTVDEETMRKNCPLFFKTKHGKRETYTYYKGFIIVRNTVQFTRCRPERQTSLYIYFPNLENRPDLFYVNGSGNSVKSAKRRVEKILATESLKLS